MMNSTQRRVRFSPVRLQAASFVLALAVVGGQWAQAQTFRVLHTFHYSDGWGASHLLLDSAGNIYGTTGSGGHCSYYHQGCGTAFKLTPSGKLVWVHIFNGVDGMGPNGLLVDKAGNFYGTTVDGGFITSDCPAGCGVVFKLDRLGKKETVLYKFKTNKTGHTPEALLVADSAGNLYGTTIWGGIQNNGVMFKVSQTGKETVLYTFKGGTDGGEDRPGVIWGKSGYLYGIAGFGADDFGLLFQIDARTDTYNVLFNFDGNPAGFNSVLLEDAAGNLYGTTKQGGNSGCGGTGCGAVGKLTPHSDGSWTASTLYIFCSLDHCADGEYPELGPLVRDAAGNLYGTTYFGGAAQCDGVNEGCGVVFKLDPSGKETILHTFTGRADGAFPGVGLTMDSSGNLYGTTVGGGDLNCEPKYYGCGVVFKITP
jgi:uncharacterized repeat protein (TIGR03803 family)